MINKELWLDNNGRHINAHGGGIMEYKGVFYWYGEHKGSGLDGKLAYDGVHMYYSENLPGLEAMFLIGDFGVSESEEITALPEKLFAGDWGKQGLRHYAGNVSYSREVEIPDGGAYLNIDAWGGTLLGVKIDDRDEKILPWPPYEVWIPEGIHTLSITVYGNRRNAMGPFFCDTLRPAWTGPNQFKALDVDFRQLVPFGLLEDPLVKMVKICKK